MSRGWLTVRAERPTIKNVVLYTSAVDNGAKKPAKRAAPRPKRPASADGPAEGNGNGNGTSNGASRAKSTSGSNGTGAARRANSTGAAPRTASRAGAVDTSDAITTSTGRPSQPVKRAASRQNGARGAATPMLLAPDVVERDDGPVELPTIVPAMPDAERSAPYVVDEHANGNGNGRGSSNGNGHAASAVLPANGRQLPPPPLLPDPDIDWAEPSIVEPALEPATIEALQPPRTIAVPITDAAPSVELFDAQLDGSGPLPLPIRPLRPPLTVRRRSRPRVRRVTRVIRHVDTWSVFKVALIFNVFLYVVCLTAGVLLWQVAQSTGTVDNVQKFFEGFGWEKFELKGGEIFHELWIAGLFVVVALTGFAVLLATLFNLITDLVGGIRVSVLEEEVVARQERSSRWTSVAVLPHESQPDGPTS